MLDRSGANNRIIFRWLGGMVAEPVWGEDDTVGFYVRDDKGGRLEEVICQPASAQDLQGLLRDDLAKLRQRFDQSRGETPTERTLRKILMRTFQDMVNNPARTDLDSYFFRYRDVMGNWRLIWCWGYERLDHEPAPSVVCTDPECNLLFVRRPGKSPRCPSCAGTAPDPAEEQDELESHGPGPTAAAVAAVWNGLVADAAGGAGRHPGPIYRPGRHPDRLPGDGKGSFQEEGRHARRHRYHFRPPRGQIQPGGGLDPADGRGANQDRIPI